MIGCMDKCKHRNKETKENWEVKMSKKTTL